MQKREGLSHKQSPRVDRGAAQGKSEVEGAVSERRWEGRAQGMAPIVY